MPGDLYNYGALFEIPVVESLPAINHFYCLNISLIAELPSSVHFSTLCNISIV